MTYQPKLPTNGLTPELVAAKWTVTEVIEVVRIFLQFGPGLSEKEVFIQAFHKCAPCLREVHIVAEWELYQTTKVPPREIACWFMAAAPHIRS